MGISGQCLQGLSQRVLHLLGRLLEARVGPVGVHHGVGGVACVQEVVVSVVPHARTRRILADFGVFWFVEPSVQLPV